MSKKILIVDDCLELRKLVFLALDDSGYQLSLASSADEAMGLLGDSPPDLIVLDVMMPGKLNGYQFCLLIKNTPRYRSVKVLLLTARSQKADILEGIRVKSDGYMVKPFSPTMLQIKVAELLGDSDALNSESPPEYGPNDKQGRIGAEVSFPPRPENLVNIRQEPSPLACLKRVPACGY
ncbi:MAG: response regulator [Methylovulum sp.]|nr:response regulator [Methylovulum sp.]